jgi:hypothetical protein
VRSTRSRITRTLLFLIMRMSSCTPPRSDPDMPSTSSMMITRPLDPGATGPPDAGALPLPLPPPPLEEEEA